MSPVLSDAIGAGAAICSTTSFAPQLLKIWREKASADVSLRMYVLTVGAFVLWIAYGALLGSWPLLAANVVSLALASAILLLQLRYRGRGPGDRSRPAR
jgi:MtN3 and saliva related transmembrane protein